MLGRVVHSADFRRLLATPSCTRSAHFALHHAQGAPGASSRVGEKLEPKKLSTDVAVEVSKLVDNHGCRLWLGVVLPKRHARRSVTRNLLRRQIRGAMVRHAASLPAGLWVVRLRTAFARGDFVSASSRLLSLAARTELDTLLSRAARS